jgi:hypothetical protein
MWTLVTAEIDGYTVVTGLDQEIIDPVATKKTVLEARKSEIDKAAKTADELGKEYNKNYSHLMSVSKLPGRRPTPEEEKIVTDSHNSYAAARQKLFALLTVTPEDIREHAIYFEPRSGEQAIADETANEIASKLRNLGEDQVLTSCGEVIPSKVGIYYFRRVNGEIKLFRISKIGEDIPSDGFTKMTAEQDKEYKESINLQRIATLTPEQKQAEKNEELKLAISCAAGRRSELEILEHHDPFGEAKRYYAELCEEIERKYR